MTQIPDSFNTDQLAALLKSHGLPISEHMPKLTFGDTGKLQGTGDLYFAICCMIDAASNRPTPIQVLGAICGLGAVVISKFPAGDDLTQAVDTLLREYSPRSAPVSPATRAALLQQLEHQTTRLKFLIEELGQIHNEWMAAGIREYALELRSRPDLDALLRGSDSVISEVMLTGLGITREQFQDYLERAKQGMG
jgi:hypothetical protein